MQISQADINRIFNYFDDNKDQIIDIHEFIVNLKAFAKQDAQREKYRVLFKGEREPLNLNTK